MARGFLGRAIDASAAALGLEKDADGNFQVKLDGATLARGAGGLSLGTVNIADLADGADVFQRDGSVVATGDFDMDGNTVTGLAAPSANSDAATKGYVDQQVIQGRSWKETLLIPEQLATGDGTAGILGSSVYYLSGNPTADDTVTLVRAGAALKTWTWKVARGGDGEITIGADASASMDNFVTAINTDSASFEALAVSTLDSIAAKVVVIRMTSVDYLTGRIYAATNTGDVQKHVSFAGLYDYRSVTLATVPAADPGAGFSTANFGINRAFASLAGGMTHNVLSDDLLHTYDADSFAWTSQSGGVYTNGDGVTLTGNEFSLNLAAAGGLQIVGGELTIDFSTNFTFNGNVEFTQPLTVADATAVGEAAALGQVVITVLERITSEVTDTSAAGVALADTLTISPLNADACILYVDRAPCFGMGHLAGVARDFSLGGAGNTTITWLGQQGGASAAGYDLDGTEILVAQYSALAHADVTGDNEFGDVLGHPSL